MTAFVHVDYSLQHPGVARLEAAIHASRQMVADISRSTGLLAAAVRLVAWFVHSASAAALRWAQERRSARAEAQLWEMALRDPRVMAELRCARG